MAKLLFQGHGSFRITTDNKSVIYVDPYVGEGYDIPADIILVTHQHGDHNQTGKPAKKSTCVIIQNQDALQNGSYKSFDIGGVNIQAVPAYNSNHDRKQCVGYILAFDGIKLYAAGDTSTTKEMKDYTSMSIDYALLPTDGIYNMDEAEASRCADLIGAKHAIPIHMVPGALFDAKKAEAFTAKNRLIVKAGEEIELK
ncbi:MAG TPA: MBL fold metallo-hydrolase [Clostridia bacterium]|nr:MBL fold metallo-hydrolase [Clostridia bacterium]